MMQMIVGEELQETYDKVKSEEQVDMSNLTWSNLMTLCLKDHYESKKRPSPHLVPYADALYTLHSTSLSARYFLETARDLVPYFLNNAQTWRGPVARAVKAELKRRLAQK